jgi:hypothetical protein
MLKLTVMHSPAAVLLLQQPSASLLLPGWLLSRFFAVVRSG